MTDEEPTATTEEKILRSLYRLEDTASNIEGLVKLIAIVIVGSAALALFAAFVLSG